VVVVVDVVVARGFLGFLVDLLPPMATEEIEIEIVSKLGSVPVCTAVAAVCSSFDILFFLEETRRDSSLSQLHDTSF
jgi:hypothetical protein